MQDTRYVNINSELLETASSANNIVLEAIDRTLPKSIKEFYQKKSNREVMLKKYGNNAFLIPDKLKFPIINPKTGEKDCRLIYAAYIRAKQWSDKTPQYKTISEKARKMYEKLNCSNKIKINIQDSEIVLDLDAFVTTFDTTIKE